MYAKLSCFTRNNTNHRTSLRTSSKRNSNTSKNISQAQDDSRQRCPAAMVDLRLQIIWQKYWFSCRSTERATWRHVLRYVDTHPGLHGTRWTWQWAESDRSSVWDTLVERPWLIHTSSSWANAKPRRVTARLLVEQRGVRLTVKRMLCSQRLPDFCLLEHQVHYCREESDLMNKWFNLLRWEHVLNHTHYAHCSLSWIILILKISLYILVVVVVVLIGSDVIVCL